MLTIAELRSGDSAACTLAGEGKSPVQVAEEGKAIDLLDHLLGELPEEVWLALPDEIFGQIAAYVDDAGWKTPGHDAEQQS